jgi:hypothetical protein
MIVKMLKILIDEEKQKQMVLTTAYCLNRRFSQMKLISQTFFQQLGFNRFATQGLSEKILN